MNETSLKVNMIPSPTWRWLKLNEVQVKLPESLKKSDVRIEKPDTVTVFEDADQMFSLVKGGMGDDLDHYANQLGIPGQAFCGAETENTLRLTYAYENEANEISRIGVLAEAGSDLLVIMDFDGQEASGTAIVQTRLIVQKNARIRLVQLVHMGSQIAFFNDVGAQCDQGARFELIQVIIGDGKSYHGTEAALTGDRSSLKSTIGYMTTGKGLLDVNLAANHFGKKSLSEIEVSGVLDDEAKKVFRGTIDFRNGSSGAKGDEKEDVLLLSDHVINQTIPVILCQEEDVEGGHGATIGKIDEELLFYLESRGIEEDQVYDMLSNARVDAVIRLIPDEEARAKAARYLNGTVITEVDDE